MRTRHINLNHHFVLALSLFVGLVISACFTSSAGAFPVQATRTVGSPPFAAKLQPLLVAKMKQLRIPGAIIYVDDPSQGSWTTTLGTSNLATGTPMNVNSHMRIGSITKTLTATVILQLVDEGKLHLDDSVGKYQPEVPNGVNITIRELLNMKSGLFDYSTDDSFTKAYLDNPYRAWEPKEMVAFAFKHQPYFAPGKGWHYDNTNYILLGMIIEQITHQPVEDVFQHRIFAPLGMVDSSIPPRSSSRIPNPHPQGYMYGTDFNGKGATLNVTDWNPSWGWTAGSAISTLHDLKIWARALAIGQLLSTATQKERLSWVSTGIQKAVVQYGLGVANFGGWIGHNGQIMGYQSWMGYLPLKGAKIIVLVNLYAASDGTEPADDLTKVIQKELFA